jgi:phage terminase large subunit
MRLAIAKTEASRLVERLPLWKAEPCKFVWDVFGATPDPWQAEFLEAFPTSPRLAMVACANPGKTAALAWTGWNFVATRPHAQAVATAITGTNLRDNLWKELAYWHGRAPLLQAFFECGTQKITARGFEKTWFIGARTWDRDASAEQQGKVLAGLHARYVLFLLDEAGGIPDAVAKTAENALGGGDDTEAHVVLAGNPLELSGPLYRAAVTQRNLWRVVRVTGDPDDPNRAPRVSRKWAQEQIDAYGRDSAYVQVYVLGKFPTASTDALVSLDQFEHAFERWEHRAELAGDPFAVGVDVARYGSDRTVVAFRAGDTLQRFEPWQGQDTVYSSGRVAELVEQWAEVGCSEDPDEPLPAVSAKGIPIMVDDVGVGGGVTDQLQAAGYNAIGVNVGAAPLDKKKHLNLRSELNLAMQDRFREGLIAIEPGIRDTTTLMAEGTTLKVGYSTGSRRKIEGKDEYKKRTGRSPDYWDALVLAFDPRAHTPWMT